jgi:hypothetical protein
MHDAKARHRDYGTLVLQKSQSIALTLLHLDTVGEFFCGQLRPKLAHHPKATINLLATFSYSHYRSFRL